MKKDFSIQVINKGNENSFKQFDVWSLIENRGDFIISHLKIYTISPLFYSNNTVDLGDKQYLLWNYILPEDSSCCLIYDFNKHFLAPLNVEVKKSDKWIIEVPALSSVFVSVSVL
jgi:hypothetical protein